MYIYVYINERDRGRNKFAILGFEYQFRMGTSLPKSESENLFKVTMQGKWEEVVKIYERNPRAHKMRITHEGGTALYLAVIEGKECIVRQLVNMISNYDKGPLEIQNDTGMECNLIFNLSMFYTFKID